MDSPPKDSANHGHSVNEHADEIALNKCTTGVNLKHQAAPPNANDALDKSSNKGDSPLWLESTSRTPKPEAAEQVAAVREQEIVKPAQGQLDFRSLAPSTEGLDATLDVPQQAKSEQSLAEQSLTEQSLCTQSDGQVRHASSPRSDGSNWQRSERVSFLPLDQTEADILPVNELPPSTHTGRTEAVPPTAHPSIVNLEKDTRSNALPEIEDQAERKDDSQGSSMALKPVPTWAENVLEPSTSLTVETLAMQNHYDHQDHRSVEDDSSHYHDTDSDSALGDMSTVSSMTSVTSSIYESVTENGRTYHSYKSGKYVLPNDVKEQGRLETQHYLLCEAIGGKLYKAPLEPHKVNRVLDIATGTGIWAIEFADDFPNAEVIGTDLTPIQPRWCPPNCYFEVDDAEDEWIYTSPFSYIHGRALLSCFENPEDVISKCAANLEPGGWLEFQDAVIPFVYDPPNIPSPFEPFDDKEPDCVLRKWEKLTIEASIIGRRPWTNVQYYKKWFEQAGLVDVSEFRTKMPVGQWEGQTKRERKMGAVHFSNMYHGLEGMTLRNLTRLGWTFEQSQNLVESVRKEMLTKRYKPSNEYVVVMGRKPEAAEVLPSD